MIKMNIHHLFVSKKSTKNMTKLFLPLAGQQDVFNIFRCINIHLFCNYLILRFIRILTKLVVLPMKNATKLVDNGI